MTTEISNQGPQTILSTQSIKPETLKKLVVNINNKTIILDTGSSRYEEWVTLSAFALGESESKYKFAWTLIDKPKSKVEGTIKHMNSQTISLSHLVAGVYIFKVSVHGEESYGEAAGNITVLPVESDNKAPVAVIVQPNQVVKLPNSGIILDGSVSSDDKKIVSYHWDLVMGPLGYKLKQERGPTLQMTDLVPGNYTVMLKVKDEDGLEGNTTASVAIIKETDYPPTANAGGDKIIYLPQTEKSLNGSLSTDDHAIVEWEWTKGPEDSGNAVDMQDTRLPVLRLSNLEVGHYHFILKVMDTVHQTSTSSAHVYVHSQSETAPTAKAGRNQTIVIPHTKTVLDGSESTSVSTKTKILWKQLSGPSVAKFSAVNEIRTKVSGLTKGTFVFQLLLCNPIVKGQISSSNVSVAIIQEKNAPPLANAGRDFSVVLPSSVVVVNGSLSTDDVDIVKWLWERDPNSLAAGVVIKNSNNSPILLFTDVVPGRYVWHLTVWDDQGSSSNDSVSIIVKEGPDRLDEVEIMVGVSIEYLSHGQLQNFLQKLQILLHNSTTDVFLSLISVNGEMHAGKLKLVVLGKMNKHTIKGTHLVEKLREKTSTNFRDKILNFPILSIDTAVCQSNCSGHGECIQSTRECRCQSWWMESVIRRRFSDGVPNCDWSVIYVFVGIALMVVLMLILLWVMYHFMIKNSLNLKTKAQYSRLENGVRGQAKAPNNLLDSDSDSDSDNNVVFELRNSKTRHNNGHLKLYKLRA